jgi:hypothetical protein
MPEVSKLFSIEWLVASTVFSVVSSTGFTMKMPTATMIPTATPRRTIPEVRLPKRFCRNSISAPA